MKKFFILTLFMFQALFAEDIYATFDVVSEKKSELGLSVSGIVATLNVNIGDKVKKGDLLVEVNLDKIKAAGLNSITPVLISNTDTYDKISLQKEGDVLFDEAVLKIL